MKALTISQPFASLIASGEKWIENRTWETLYRGELAIHAGKGTQYLSNQLIRAGQYPTGAIIATAVLVACVHVSQVVLMDNSDRRKMLVPGTTRNWSEVARHSHCKGPFCWILQNVAAVEPVIMRGRQGLWSVPDETTFEAIRDKSFESF